MTLGKISHNLTFEDGAQYGAQYGGLGRVFNGMDVTAQFVNPKGKMSTITFHYDYYTNDVRGLVERALTYHQEGRGTPKNYKNVSVEE